MRISLDLGLGSGRRGSGVPAAAPSLVSADYTIFDNAGGDSITLTGTDLGSASAVDVGGTSATITSNTATSVTFTTPATAAGTKNVTVTTPGGTSNALVIEAYDLDGNAFSGWHRAPPVGTWAANATPWPSTPSAGTSGTATAFSEATNPPTPFIVGNYQAVNFDGSSQSLTSGASSQHVTTAAGTIAILCYADTAGADTVGARIVKGIYSQVAFAFICLGLSVAGLRGSLNDGTFDERGPLACSTGAWHLVVIKWSGGSFKIGVDGTYTASLATGGPSALAANSRLGRNYDNVTPLYFDGKMLEVMFSQAEISDAELVKLQACLKCRYGL